LASRAKRDRKVKKDDIAFIRLLPTLEGMHVARASIMTNSQLITPLDVDAEMTGIGQKETVDLRLCYACEAELRESDRFCRRCGVRQSGHIAPEITKDDLSDSLTVFAAGLQTPSHATSSLSQEILHRPVSGPLAKAVAAGASSGPLAFFYSPLAQKMIMALITFPIWLIIVLLSPLDAYATAKSVSGRTHVN